VTATNRFVIKHTHAIVVVSFAMNTSLIAAAAVLAFVGLGHSVLGEIMIFRRLGRQWWIPAEPAPPLRSRHIRILWASWHVVTVFGWACSAILLRIATAASMQNIGPFAVRAIAIASLVSAVLVFIATRARHPGWIGLLAAALLLLY
jgi:hypothetical protein